MTENDQNADHDPDPERPESFSRRYGFRKYSARWHDTVGGERLRIAHRKTRHTFGRGHEPHGPERTVFNDDQKTANELYELLGIMLGRREPYHVDNYGNALSEDPPEDWTDVEHRIRKSVMDTVRDLEFEGVPPDRAARELRFVANELSERRYEILGSELDVGVDDGE